MRVQHTVQALLGAVAVGALALGLAGCSDSGSGSVSPSANGKIGIVASVNQYGNVAKQIGGSHVDVTSVISDPEADPHDFEAKPSTARLLANARIVVENGLGYDDWLDKMLKTHKGSDRTVVSAQKVRGLPDSTKNPHLWYDPQTMPAVAAKIADQLKKDDPEHADDYAANLKAFDASMQKYTDAITAFAAAHPNTPVAATEPVANFMLDAVKADIKTPWSLQADIMNDSDPSAQDTATQMSLFQDKTVQAFVYNEQVTSDLTTKFKTAAKDNGIPLVAVYETMPPKSDYVTWMVDEVNALSRAVEQKQSTDSLE